MNHSLKNGCFGTGSNYFQKIINKSQNLELRYHYPSDNNRFTSFKSIKLNKSDQQQLSNSIEIVDEYEKEPYIITSISDHSIYFEKGINTMVIKIKDFKFLSSSLLNTDYKLTSKSENALKKIIKTHNPFKGSNN